MSNKLKDMLLNGTTLFIPTICKFSTSKKKKWVRPIDREVKTKIKFKKKLWKKFIKTKDIVDYKKYKDIRTRSDTILDNYIEMNKIILLKNVNQIQKYFGITVIVKVKLKVIIRLTIYLIPMIMV